MTRILILEIFIWKSLAELFLFLSQKKRAFSSANAGFFLFLTSSLGPNNLLRADSEFYHVDFDGVAFMAVLLVSISHKTLINFGYLLLIFSLPVAILKTFAEMVSLLATMDGNALEMTSTISEFYTIFLVGCFLSACGYFIDERQKFYETRTLSNLDVVICFLLLVTFNVINIYAVILRSDLRFLLLECAMARRSQA